MKTVRQLNEKNACIVVYGKEHLLESFGLGLVLGGKDFFQLAQSVHQTGDLAAEQACDLFSGIISIGKNMVKQGCYNGFTPEPDFIDHNKSHVYTMQDDGIARYALLVLVGLSGKTERTQYQFVFFLTGTTFEAAFPQLIKSGIYFLRRIQNGVFM